MTAQNACQEAANYDSNPTWSPDGTTLAFERLNENNIPVIVLLKASEGAAQVFSSAENGNTSHMPSWSPNGKMIVFSHGTIQPWLVMGQIGSSEFTDFGLRPARNPNFSPDGFWIVYSSNSDIYRVQTTGSEVTQLTEGPANDFDPVWQP